MNIIILTCSYLLAFVQLTWPVYDGWFLPVFGNFLLGFSNIRSLYIRRWAGEELVLGGWWQSLNKEARG